MHKIRILLADDHPVIRAGIRNILENHREFLVVGEAKDGDEAIRETRTLMPDVAILDLSMPGLSGIVAARTIRKKFPATKVLVLTIHDNDQYVYQVFKLGAGGYVLKTADETELRAAILAVARGERFFSRRVSDVVMRGFLRRRIRKRAPQEDRLLTEREKEILALIAEGMRSQQIADRLFISRRTVDTHRANLMRKLNIHDVMRLVQYALQQGYVKQEESSRNV